MPYFRMVETTLSSAMKCFTVLFEMGRSGTTSLLSPSNSCLLLRISFYTASYYSLCTYLYTASPYSLSKNQSVSAIVRFNNFGMIYSIFFIYVSFFVLLWRGMYHRYFTSAPLQFCRLLTQPNYYSYAHFFSEITQIIESSLTGN